jgi:hypothetical protein
LAAAMEVEELRSREVALLLQWAQPGCVTAPKVALAVGLRGGTARVPGGRAPRRCGEGPGGWAAR